ncbi:unnamed protein product [Mytilus edulis]|uniref:Uncharacterized protein n=1 Tax=Mytilus edulis TaxID=6550 RepID=A0A8S3QNG9_MYTED|nr:unnamed protein product [Mytilus edulis]
MTDGSMHHQDTKSNAARSLCCRYESVQLERLPQSFNENFVIIEGTFIIHNKPIRSYHKTFKDIIEYLVCGWILHHAKLSVDEIHILFDRTNKSESWQQRRQLLLMFSLFMRCQEVLQLIPDLTELNNYTSKRHGEKFGYGLPAPQADHTDEKWINEIGQLFRIYNITTYYQRSTIW